MQTVVKGPYAAVVQSLLQSKLVPGKRFVDNEKVSDHHAIIPTEQPLDLSQLDADERRLYDLIARRFITVLSPPFKYNQTTMVTMVNGERFYSRGKVVIDMGWRKVTTLPADTEDEKEDRLPEQTLTQQRKGVKKPVKNCKLHKSQTKPPARYTEATLLTAMENPGKFVNDETLRAAVQENGLGTPATRAEIIEKLLSTHYIERVGKELHPTSKGKQLIGLVPPALKSPALTAQWELRLAKISKGKEDNQKFLSDIRENASELVQVVREDTSTFKIDNLTNKKCPMCGKFMMVVNTKNKRGRTFICSDISCRYEEVEQQNNITDFRKTKEEARMGKRLIDKFSDNRKKVQAATLGDLFEAALKKDK